MPELPEVETARRTAERVACGRTIQAVRAVADPLVFDGVAAATVRRRLLGRRVVAARRRGKHLWLELDRPPHLLFHFGMTGWLHVKGEAEVFPPRFEKLRLTLNDGRELAYADARRLGRVRFRDDPPAEPPIQNLGFDPLLDPPRPAEFAKRLLARRGPVKAVLLDQSFAAGVGNWVADEVLYHAQVDPRRSAARLTGDEAERIRRSLRTVVRKAVAVDADATRFPKTWLFHHRWGRRRKAAEPPRTARGEPIHFTTIAGRTTAFVPPDVRPAKRE